MARLDKPLRRHYGVEPDVEMVQRAVEEAVGEVQEAVQQPFGVPVQQVINPRLTNPTIVEAFVGNITVAKLGDLYPLDGTRDNDVYLPPAEVGSIGQSLTIVNNTRGVASIRVHAQKNDTVNGASVKTVIGPWKLAICICTEKGKWAVSEAGITPVGKGYHFTSRGIGAGDWWVAGYYDAAVADANLTQASTTAPWGTANGAYGAHAFIVAAGPGAAASGQVGLRATGTSITDEGVRTGADTEVLTADVTTLTANQYLETSKKWIGIVTFELFIVSGAPATYSADFNYGWAKYDDIGNRDFTITDLEAVGLAAATDALFDILLFKHDDQNWTYSAGAFSPGGTVLAQMSVDYVTERSAISNDYFAYKRANLLADVAGSASEGFLIRVVTGQPNTVQDCDLHIGGFLRL